MVFEFNEEKALEIFEKERDIVFLLINSKEADADVLKVFEDAAKTLDIRTKLLFSYSRIDDEGIQENLARQFDVEKANLPFLVFFKHEGQ